MIAINASRFNVRAASRVAILVVALAAVAAFPAFAAAQTVSPAGDQYGNALQQVSQGEVPQTPPPTPVCVPDSSDSSSGSSSCAPPSAGLPFTGLDVVGLGAVALLLTLGGLALRRARFAETTET